MFTVSHSPSSSTLLFTGLTRIHLTWRRLLFCAVVLGSLCTSTQAAQAKFPPLSKVYLDGKLVVVRWTDGDTFKVQGPVFRGLKARLKQYNTLENYGPVHRWGRWKARELQKLADRSSTVARSKRWKCRRLSSGGGYGRRLVTCPGLAAALIRRGLAHVFSMRGPGSRKLCKLQKAAIAKKRGIWAKGVPAYIVTSVHPANSRYPRTFNRLISTKDGASKIIRNRKRYRSCQWICLRGSCMRYVPHSQRYGYRKAPCLR